MAAVGESVSYEIFTKIIGAMPAGTTPAIYYAENLGGTILSGLWTPLPAAQINGVLPLRECRMAVSRTLTAATVDSTRIGLWYRGSAIGHAPTFTWRVGIPGIKKMPFVTSPSLPPVGVPGASLRTADDLSMTDIARWFNPAAGTFVMDFTPGQASTGAFRYLLRLDDGTDSNRIALLLSSTNTDVGLTAFSAGSLVADISQASGAALVRHTARISYGHQGWMLSVNGAAPLVVAGALPAGITRCLLGRDASDGYLNGWLGPRLDYYPVQYTDTAADDGFTIRTR
jgi:hypothetical protein